MRKIAIKTLKRIALAIAYSAIGAFVVLLVLFIYYVNSQPELAIWHTVELDEEFTRKSKIDSLEGYLELEDRLFRQLEELVYKQVPEEKRTSINRYARGSRADPAQWERNWNRTFVLDQEKPTAGVLLLHGMSDSPYSMRHLATRLHKGGAYAVGMRMPGHGAAPSGLTRATWEDMAAAVRIGVRHVRQKIGDKPLYLVGYSNGAALSVEYAISALEDSRLPQPDGLVLLSPMIGVTPAAAFAIWQERIGRWLGLTKLQWNSVMLEFDPFKYGSFAVNAGNQTYRLASDIDERLQALHDAGELQRFPRLIAFQSAADATVSAPALIKVLMDRMSGGEHELVIFDVNRTAEAENMIKNDPRDKLNQLLAVDGRPYTLTLITNVSETDARVESRRSRLGASQPKVRPLGLAWPPSLFSLSHLALPFPGTDALYGSTHDPETNHVHLGDLALRGERGVLAITPGEMLRVRWNPFYSYLEAHALAFTGLK